jgi:DNA-binding Lrp family transcriptional regulator
LAKQQKTCYTISFRKGIAEAFPLREQNSGQYPEWKDTAMDKLLKLLRQNALESTKNLSRMLGVPEKDIRRKIEQYEKRGIIRGYQAIVNVDRIDLDRVRAVIEVRVTPEREGGFDKVARRISRFDEVKSIFLMSGGYDLQVVVEGRNLKDVAFFVSEKLATIQGVISTGTHFILKTYKDHGVLMDAEKTDERLPITP